MPKTRQQKKDELSALVAHLGAMKSVVFTSYQGLKVNEATALRKQLRTEGVVYKVVKRTLLARALSQTGLPVPALPKAIGGVALAFGVQDEVLPAKLLDTFRKEHASVAFQGGIVQGRACTAAEIYSLAKLPSRQAILASILSTCAGPLRGLCVVASGPMRGVAQALRARSEHAQ